MTHPAGLDRRQFLRTTAGGGFALGSLFGLGMDLRAAQEEVRHLKIAGAKEVPSVCPYCAVGCGQIVSVRDNKIINIEGNPDSPISQALAIASLGGATMDNEWNYVQCKLFRGLGGVFLENQARI